MYPLANDVGGLHVLQGTAAGDQPPPAWHVLVWEGPKNPGPQTHVYWDAPGAKVGVTAPVRGPEAGSQGLHDTPGGLKAYV